MKEKIIDFRSDTVTLPTPEMMEAIQKALLGDDVFREDPTINELEETAARLFKKEAGLLVTSGTQGNLISVLAQTDGRGSEIILEKDSHIAYYEVGGIAALGGVMMRAVPGNHGYITPDEVSTNIRGDDIHLPRTKLVSLENTHNRAGGTLMNKFQMDAIGKVAREAGIGFHVDGARIFNAAVATETGVDVLTETATSVTFCLSKGLSCPVGSVIVGEKDFIDRARKVRKQLGGGMRQAGIIAAPGLVALKNWRRLKEDHDNAKRLAKGLKSLISNPLVTVPEPQTNIMFIRGLGSDGPDIQEKLGKRNVLTFALGPSAVRFVTHRMISQSDVEEALARMEPVFKSL